MQGTVDGNEDIGKLSERGPSPLSAEETSPEPESDGGYESTTERSILSCSQKILISRLMDEICSSFSFSSPMVHASVDRNPGSLSPLTVHKRRLAQKPLTKTDHLPAAGNVLGMMMRIVATREGTNANDDRVKSPSRVTCPWQKFGTLHIHFTSTICQRTVTGIAVRTSP